MQCYHFGNTEFVYHIRIPFPGNSERPFFPTPSMLSSTCWSLVCHLNSIWCDKWLSIGISPAISLWPDYRKKYQNSETALHLLGKKIAWNTLSVQKISSCCCNACTGWQAIKRWTWLGRLSCHIRRRLWSIFEGALHNNDTVFFLFIFFFNSGRLKYH